MDLSVQKKDFPVLRDNPKLAYLDSAAMALKPDCVIKAVDDYYNKLGVNVHRGVYGLSYQATDKYEEARTNIANSLGAQFEEIVFTRIGSTERCYAYVPYQYNQFYIKNYSYQDNGQDLQSGKIQLSEGYSSTNWMLHKQGNWWSTWTIGGSQAYWGT